MKVWRRHLAREFQAYVARQAGAVLDPLHRDQLVRRERREEEDEAERVVDVAQRVCKRGVALTDEVVELVLGPARVEPHRLLLLEAACGAADLLEEGLLLAELFEERLVHQELDVLGEVVGGVAALKLLLGLARVDALKDAEPAKVLQRHLQLLHRLRPGRVLAGTAHLLLDLTDAVTVLELLLLALLYVILLFFSLRDRIAARTHGARARSDGSSRTGSSATGCYRRNLN